MGQPVNQSSIIRGFDLLAELRYPKTNGFILGGRAVSAFLGATTAKGLQQHQFAHFPPRVMLVAAATSGLQGA